MMNVTNHIGACRFSHEINFIGSKITIEAICAAANADVGWAIMCLPRFKSTLGSHFSCNRTSRDRAQPDLILGFGS